MRRWLPLVLAACLAAALSGCVPDGLPPGDRDEIGLEGTEPTEPVRGTVGSANAASKDPVPVGSGFGPSDMVTFVTAGEASGPAESGRVAGTVETDGLLWTDAAGDRWVDCEVLNAACGEEVVRETEGGRLYVRYASLDRSDWVWDLDGPRLLVRLDALSGFGSVTGLDEEALSLGIEAGSALSDKDRPVFEAVVGAIEEESEVRALVFDFRMPARYAYGGTVYARTDDGPVDCGDIQQDPDGTAFDGRRVWYDREDRILVDGGDGTALTYART